MGTLEMQPRGLASTAGVFFKVYENDTVLRQDKFSFSDIGSTAKMAPGYRES